MARAVRARCWTHPPGRAGRHRTGKSLAYLIPAIRHAIARDTTVVISTATIALQRQLVTGTCPASPRHSPRAGPSAHVRILKGRRNYLCLHRLSGPDEVDDGEQLFDPFAISAMGRHVKRLHEWSSETDTGDRDELVPGVPTRRGGRCR